VNPLALELNSWCSLQKYRFKRQKRKKRERKKREKKNKRKVKKKTVELGKYLRNWLMHMLLCAAPMG